MLNIPGKTLLLIGGLITLTVILMGVAIWTASKSPQKPATVANVPAPTPTVVKTAVLSFSPASLNMTTATTPSASIDVMVDTMGTPITGAQFEIDYDPTAITNVTFSAPDATNSLLGPVGNYRTLFVDSNTPGKIVVAQAVSETATPVNGTGSVGKLSFTVVKGVKPTTQLQFGKESIVTSDQTSSSILKSTTPLSITLQ